MDLGFQAKTNSEMYADRQLKSDADKGFPLESIM